MPASPPIPRLFVDHSGPALSNVGDLAMLMVAVRRLRTVFPGAILSVPTHDAPRLLHYCPGTVPISEPALSLLFWRHLFPTSVARAIPGVARLESLFRERFPWPHARAVATRNALRRERPEGTPEALAALRHADAFLAAGGGYFNDLFPGHISRVLGVLGVGMARRRPVALLGQGLGPVADPDRRRTMARVFRRARRIGLREGLEGPHLLRELNAFDERSTVTGDDAIELAWEHRPALPGTALGFNVRVASYSGVDDHALGRLRDGLRSFLQRNPAPLLGCPISFGTGDHDPRAIAALLAGLPGIDRVECANDPIAVIQRIGACRAVVTGSYHAAVFALSQGIPVLALARSEYYTSKFAGLAAQFGNACRPVRLDAPDFPERFDAVLDALWNEADHLRGPTLDAAERQVRVGQALYQSLPEFLS